MTDIKPRCIRARRLLSLIQLGLVVGTIAFTWPTSLGGQVSYVQVSGKSMYPTYQAGDLVVTRTRATYQVGDPVVYRIPKGDVGAGAQVVHRIIGGNARTGFILQGDNNEYRDVWKPRHHDVVGRVVLHIPRAGVWVAHMAQPINLGILCGTLTMMSLLWPRRDRRGTNKIENDQAITQPVLPQQRATFAEVSHIPPESMPAPEDESSSFFEVFDETEPADEAAALTGAVDAVVRSGAGEVSGQALRQKTD